MNPLDVVLVLAFTLPFVMEWTRLPNNFTRYGVVFTLTLMSFFVVAFTLSIHLAGAAILFLTFGLYDERRDRMAWAVTKRLARVQHAVASVGSVRVRRLVSLSDSITSLSHDLLRDVGHDVVFHDPFVSAMNKLTDVMFERECRRCNPVSQAR